MKLLFFGLGLLTGLLLNFADLYQQVIQWNSAELQAGVSASYIAWAFYKASDWNLLGTAASLISILSFGWQQVRKK